MPDSVDLDCPECGSPVPVTKADRVMMCAACGTETVIDPALAVYELMFKYPDAAQRWLDTKE